jgi:hypothetical protein
MSRDKNEWPVVVYMWAVGLVGYLIFSEMILELKPHLIHWVAGLIGAV